MVRVSAVRVNVGSFTRAETERMFRAVMADAGGLNQSAHNRTPESLSNIKSNRLSCLSSRCHDTVHDVGTLSDVTFWKEQF